MKTTKAGRIGLVLTVGALVASLVGCSASPTEQPATASTVVLGVPIEVTTLDPQVSSSTSIFQITAAVYETLLATDLKTKTKDAAKIIPGLASSYDVSKDGLTYTFKIRKNVEFTDGTPLDAAAVQTNFDRMMTPASPVYNKTAASTNSQLTQWIASTAVDGDNFVVKLKSRFSGLPLLLTNPQVAIISPTLLKNAPADVAKKPVGTGPFMTTGLLQGQNVELTRNDGYWGGKVPTKTLIFVPIPDATTMATALQTGQVDVILSAGAAQIEQLKNTPDVVVQYPDPANQYFVRLNTRAAPTDNQKFREAMNFAIDRKGISAATNGQTVPLYGAVPRGNEVSGADDYYSYDVKKAKALLKESGVALPAKVKFYASTGGPGFSQANTIMALIQQNLKAVGIDADMQFVDFTALNTIQSAGYKDGSNGSLQGWTSGADQGYWLERMFGPNQLPPAGTNRGWFIDSKQSLTGLFDKARAATDPKDAKSLYQQAAKVIDEGAPWLFLYQDRLPRIFMANIKGIYESPSVYIDYTTVYKVK